MTLYGADPYYVDVNSSNVFIDPGAFAIDALIVLLTGKEAMVELS